jgi:[glutamine synthetase] adenylyltransferase / [glutamine synthetase]-adenylyl-L-tyrosine phosphorylase
VTVLATEQPAAFAEVVAEPAWLERVVAVGGVSRPLGELVGRFPDAIEGLRSLDGVDVPVLADEVAAAVAATTDPAGQAAAVAAIRRRTTADIAARDLTGVTDMEAVGRELAGLAEAVLTGTLRAVHDQAAAASRPPASP